MGHEYSYGLLLSTLGLQVARNYTPLTLVDPDLKDSEAVLFWGPCKRDPTRPPACPDLKENATPDHDSYKTYHPQISGLAIAELSKSVPQLLLYH